RESGVQFFSLKEQQELVERELVRLAPREAIVASHGSAALRMRTEDVNDPEAWPHRVERLRHRIMAKHPFWLTFDEASRRVAPPAPAPEVIEIKDYGRRVKPKPPNASDSGEDDRSAA